jgi:hypothetical protein
MAKLDGIDCCMELTMVEYRRGVIVGDECCTPDVEEPVNGGI